MDITAWLFENRNVPPTEQYGLFFEGDLLPMRSLRTAWLLALCLGFTATVTAMNALLPPAPPPPVKEWVTIAEASAAKPTVPVVTVTGRLHIEYAFTGPAVVYLQPVKGPALTVLSLVKPRSGAIGVTLVPGSYTLTVSTTGSSWTLKAEEYRLHR